MFFRRRNKKSQEKIPYDPSAERPVIKASICTGEQVAGFETLSGSHFRAHGLITNEEERRDFCRRCGIKETELKTIY